MKKVGIIGCGGIAQVHAWALSGMENVSLRVFCDVDRKKAESLVEKASDYRKSDLTESSGDYHFEISDNWKEICDSDLDVVHLCTPHHLHVPMAVRLLQSGKAVFMEKPCAVSMEQFRILKEEEAKHPGKLGFCFQNRYNETTLLTDRIVNEGQIGKVVGGRAIVTWRRDEGYYTGSTWKGKLEAEGGGALINQAIHTLDLLVRYLGEPLKIKGTASNHHLPAERIEVEDTVEAWMEFRDGKRACFYASNAYATDAPVYLELQGETGRVCINGSEVTVCREGEMPQHFLCEKTIGIGKDYWGCGHQACIRDYYDCLENGREFQNSLNGVENTFLTVMRIYHAAGKH